MHGFDLSVLQAGDNQMERITAQIYRGKKASVRDWIGASDHMYSYLSQA
jgi:hypothetical protein